MHFSARRFFSGKAVSALAIAAELLIAGALLPVNAAAQAGSGAPLPPPGPPPPVVFQKPIPSDQMAFLNDYAGKMPKELKKDKRFHALVKLAIPRTEYHYGSDKSLSDASDELLGTDGLPIEVRDGRYVMVGTHGGSYLAGKTFLWFDMKDGIALGGIYFHPTNGEPAPTLTIFSRQIADTALSIGQLPMDFAEDLDQWAMEAHVPEISPRYFIPENGKKYVLEHDEDYCWHPPDALPPQEDRCEQENADAADADMNAAYFMQETHNQANATAWMLGEDQVAWIGFRDRSCGVGQVGVSCRIRVTHERTGVLLGHAPHVGGTHPRR
jgi:uncharacterized protein YecT (DUF1311 family)